MRANRPQRPSHLSEYSELCLRALVEVGLADKLSLGGALGLLHYLDYRQTHDVDAWWAAETTSGDRSAVVATLAAALEPHGQVRTRTWGDVVSIELVQEQRKTFSFQIAQRTAQLEPATEAPWIAVPLDSLADLLASKMMALVERGAPCDFRDVYAACQAAIVPHLRNAGPCGDGARPPRAVTSTWLARSWQSPPTWRVSPCSAPSPRSLIRRRNMPRHNCVPGFPIVSSPLETNMQHDWLDGALYPDVDPPEALPTWPIASIFWRGCARHGILGVA